MYIFKITLSRSENLSTTTKHCCCLGPIYRATSSPTGHPLHAGLPRWPRAAPGTSLPRSGGSHVEEKRSLLLCVWPCPCLALSTPSAGEECGGPLHTTRSWSPLCLFLHHLRRGGSQPDISALPSAASSWSSLCYKNSLLTVNKLSVVFQPLPCCIAA